GGPGAPDEAQGLLRLDVATRDADEERIVAVLDRVDVADRERGGVPGLVHELALERDLRVAGLATVVQAAPPPHPCRVPVVAVHDPARAVVVHRRLAAL